jgi:hypothetical protein
VYLLGYRLRSAADRVRIAFRVFAITELKFARILQHPKLRPSSHQFGPNLCDILGVENNLWLATARTRSTTIVKCNRATARLKLSPSLRIIWTDLDWQSEHVTVERTNFGYILHEQNYLLHLKFHA